MKELYKKIERPLLIIALIILLIFMIKSCRDLDKEELKPNPIQQVINSKEKTINKDSLEVIRIKKDVDSLSRLTQKTRIIYKTRYDSIYITQSDTCKEALEIVYRDFNRLDSLNQLQLLKQDSVIMKDYNIKLEMRDIINLVKVQLSQSRDSLTDLKKEVNKKVRKGYFKGFKHGFGSGATLTEGANLYMKFKP